MRAFLCILLMGWLWLPFAARAQSPTITAAEYFIDSDPGVGNGNAFPVPNSPNPSVQTQVSLQGLPLGFHILGARFQDSEGNWSLARSRVFVIETPPSQAGTNTLVAFEYFINEDPGVGNGTQASISPGAQASLAIPISLQGLPEGFHTLSVRFQDQNGIWSNAKSRIFIVQNATSTPPLLPIVGAEYFIDQDPGVGSGKSLPVTSGINPQVIGNIPTEGLEPGFHTFSVRFRSQDNQWGLAKNRVFFVGDENFDKPTLVAYVEYFFDGNDPGQGKATSIPLDQPASAISVEALIAVANLPQGTHTITVRIRDTQGIWSPAVSQEFIVGNPQFTVPPVTDLAELPTIEAACAINVADLTAPTATAEDGGKVTGTVDESLFPITKQGSSEITWTFTDVSGLRSTQKQLVILEDDVPPVINIPGRVVLNATADQCVFTNVDFGAVTATDNCGEPTLTNNAPGNFGFGINVVTWTATDAAGNQVQETQEVEVVDAIPPSITAPADVTIQIAAGANGIPSANLPLGAPVIVENCGLQSVNTNSPDIFPVGVTEVEWEVIDLAGNAAKAIQKVTITTEELPTILAPAPVSFNTDAGKCEATIGDLGTPFVTGENIPDDGISNDAPEKLPVGTHVVIWTVRDGNGNTASAEQQVTVTDAELPTITAPAAVIVLATLARCDASDVTLGQPTVADNCGIKSVTNNALEIFPFGNTTVTWVVEDVNGNIATATQIVTVTEDQPPLITAPADVTVQIASDEDSATGVALGQAEVSDNCGIASVTNNALNTFPLGTTVVTWTVTDIGGNTATAAQNVTVTRETLPTITAPAAVTVNNEPGTCGASGINLGTPTVTGEDIPSNGITNTGLDTYPVGTTQVVWTVIDGRGNTATSVQTVIVVDNESPSIIAPNNVTTLTAANSCDSGVVELGQPQVSDNCGVLSLTNNAPDTFTLGSNTVIWTVVDVNGNETTAEQIVIVVDEEPPLITAPADITIRIDADQDAASNVALGQPIVSDNCGIESVINNAPSSFEVGSSTVVWTVIDESGNEATAEQTVTVTREVLPTITAPAAINADTDAGDCFGTVADLGTPSVTGEDIPADGISNDAPETFPIGTTTVTWTVRDGNGNTATATQQVTVTDREAPFILGLSDLFISADQGECFAADVSLGEFEAGDNCSDVQVSNDAPAVFSVGVHTVTWTVTDAAGNKGGTVQRVTVQDREDPVVTAPADVTIQIAPDADSATGVSLGAAQASDNCGIQSLTNDAPNVFPLGLTVVTWTATDNSGNTATAQQRVNVTREELPTINAPADITTDAGEGKCFAEGLSLGSPTFTGTGATVSNDAPDQFPVGVTPVTWTVTDANGNTATSVQRVTVADRQAPQITAPGNIAVSEGEGGDAPAIDLGNAVATDNCGIASIVNDAPAVFPVGMTVVKWTATDVNGNKSTALQVVTVDAVTPVCTIQIKTKQEITVVLNKDGKGRLTTGMVDNGTAGNCGPVKLTLSKCDFTCADIGEQKITFTAVDALGTRACTEVSVKVVDQTKPKVTVPQKPFVKVIRRGDTFVMPDLRSRVTAWDNCGFELHQCPEPGKVFRKAQNGWIEFEAKDPSGNVGKGKMKFRLLVVGCRKPGKNGREDLESSESLITVPWNTPLPKIASDYVYFEEGSDMELAQQIKWSISDFDPLKPGFYQMEGSLPAEYLDEADNSPAVTLPVLVLNKPLPVDIFAAKDRVSHKVKTGEILTGLHTVDPADDIHSYSMDEHPDVYLENNVLVWRGNHMPEARTTVTVHSTDRAGQTISRQITLYRETDRPTDLLIYPNPAMQETNLMVQIPEGANVSIRIFDAAGRLVYQEEGQHELSFTRKIDLRHFAQGMYQVIVQVDRETLQGRIIKQ